MKAISFLKIATVAAFMLVGLSVSAPVQAAGVGSWNDMARGPKLYQTNMYYNSGWVTPPASIPPTATMTGGSWVVKCFSYPVGFKQYLYIPSYGYARLSSRSGTFKASGISANQSMLFTVGIISNPTRVIVPVDCGGHQLAIFYNY